VLDERDGSATTSWPLRIRRPTFNFAWPTAEIAVIGPGRAGDIVHRRDVAAWPNPEQRARC